MVGDGFYATEEGRKASISVWIGDRCDPAVPNSGVKHGIMRHVSSIYLGEEVRIQLLDGPKGRSQLADGVGTEVGNPLVA